MPLASDLRQFANAASFSKGVFAHIIRACGTVILCFLNSICLI
jgi:hypothetical protein